ncbi:MAG TPA: nucleotidyltransferase domain-containing protein [Kofleriaceae bacterium]|nr:nucleotidyltransferase domain-containing protein [Kofleriaceae bacterium]
MDRHGSTGIRRIADALFSQTQQRVFSLLFGQPERAFGTSELIGLADSGSGAVQRELKRLLDSKLVVTSSIGRQKFYRANTAAPIFEELRSIVEKTTGVPEQLRIALAPLGSSLQLAVLYGSVAKQNDTAASDIDVLLVSDALALEDVFAALQRAERRLGRHVSPTLYTSDEFHRRRRDGQSFVSRVLTGKHMVLVGSEDAVASAR